MLDDRGIDVHSLQGQETCLHSAQTDSERESRSPSYSVGIVWASCLGVNRPRREDYHSPPSSTHVKNISHIFHSHTSLHGVNRENSHFSTSASMTFVCPCIVSITVNDDQQDATVLVYLFIPNQLYMFRAMFSPIIRST